MKVEKIQALPLTKKEALSYAQYAVEHALKKSVKRVRYLGGGSFGRAVEVTLNNGQPLVVKFLRAKGMMEKEAHDVALLKRRCTVPVPAVLFTRPADSAIPVDCYGMEKIEGKSALLCLPMLFWSKERRLRFAETVTEALHAVHTCQSPSFGDTMCPDKPSWLAFYRPFAEDVLRAAEKSHAAGKLRTDIIRTMRAAWEKFDIIFSEEVKTASLIHGDLNVGNIMVKRGAVTGFIDPLNAAYADREYDLFQFDNLTGKRFFLRETYVKRYGGSRFLPAKLAFYGLWNEVYCYLKSGVYVGLIMAPLVKNMKRQLEAL